MSNVEKDNAAFHKERLDSGEAGDRVYVQAGESHHKDKKERKLVLKQDLSIVLLLSGCYWFAYLVSASFIFLARGH